MRKGSQMSSTQFLCDYNPIMLMYIDFHIKEGRQQEPCICLHSCSHPFFQFYTLSGSFLPYFFSIIIHLPQESFLFISYEHHNIFIFIYILNLPYAQWFSHIVICQFLRYYRYFKFQKLSFLCTCSDKVISALHF